MIATQYAKDAYIGEECFQNTMMLHSDLGATGLERPFWRFEGTEMATAMATETDQPIALRGLGWCMLVYVCVRLRQVNGSTFLRNPVALASASVSWAVVPNPSFVDASLQE